MMEREGGSRKVAGEEGWRGRSRASHGESRYGNHKKGKEGKGVSVKVEEVDEGRVNDGEVVFL